MATGGRKRVPNDSPVATGFAAAAGEAVEAAGAVRHPKPLFRLRAIGISAKVTPSANGCIILRAMMQN
jgi:hypothetical protein